MKLPPIFQDNSVVECISVKDNVGGSIPPLGIMKILIDIIVYIISFWIIIGQLTVTCVYFIWWKLTWKEVLLVPYRILLGPIFTYRCINNFIEFGKIKNVN